MPKSDSSFDPESYAPVADRIRSFYERFPTGRIVTELVSRAEGEITFKALVFREDAAPHPAATGWASEREGDGDVNSVACLENTETSAVGRALANLGFTASARRPSREEMEKAQRARRRLAASSRPPERGSSLHGDADAVHDLLDLLASAERRGFSAWRAATLRAGATGSPPLPRARLLQAEAGVRAWLRRRTM
jgi:hypothetical protein